MTPMDITPEWILGIILIKQMILAFPKETAVRIIHPIARSNEMVERPIRVIDQAEP
jgi:hypothetical protein